MKTLLARKGIIILLVAAILSVSFLHLLTLVSDPDFFWHLKTGEWIWHTQSLPSEDPFSYTAQGLHTSRSHSVLTSYFLSQVTYYLFYRTGGMTGIVVLRFILLGSLIFIMIKRKEGDNILYLGLLLIFLTLFLKIYSLERPQIFSFIFFGVLLFALQKIKDGPLSFGRRTAVFISFVMLIWANTHQGYVLGQITLLLFLVLVGVKFLHPALRPSEKGAYRNLVVAGASGILISFANPNTYHTWKDMVFQPDFTIAGNVEYQSTLDSFLLFHNDVIVLYWFILCLTIAGLVLNRKKIDITEVALLAGTGYYSFSSVRYVAVFMIVALPLAGRFFSTGRILKAGAPLILLVSLTGGLFFTWDEHSNLENLTSRAWVNSAFPVDAAEFAVANNLKGNMYNYYNWGGYLIWKLAPERKVFIDGRCLDPDIVKQSILIETAYRRKVPERPAWKSVLESHEVQYILIPFSQPDGTLLPLLPALLRERDWVPVFLRGNTSIFVKDSVPNYEVITKYAIPRNYFFAALIQICDSFIRAYPQDIFPYITKGDLYLSTARFTEARQAYEKVIGIAPFNATAKERLQFISGLEQRAKPVRPRE